MKTLKMAFIAFGVLAFVSCSDPKKDVKSGEITNSANNSINNSKHDKSLNMDEMETSDEMYKLYNKLDMSENQIQDFIKKHKDRVGDLRNVENGVVDNEQLEELKDKTFKDVLTEEQWKKYQDME